jgi:hypothetical protein
MSAARRGDGEGGRSFGRFRAVARFVLSAAACFVLTGLAFFSILAVYDLSFGQFLELPWMGPVIIGAWIGSWWSVDRLWRHWAKKRAARVR